MKTWSYFLILSFLYASISCKTVVPEVTAQTNLEVNSMVSGSSELEIWINRTLVVGTVMPGMDSLSCLLEELDLEADTDRVVRYRIDVHPQPSISYSFYKRNDRAPIDSKHSRALAELRSAYFDNFGMGLYDENGIAYGVFSNIITVDFAPRTPVDRIDQILNTHEATRFFRWRENTYHVEFSKGIGYDILEVAKSLLNYDEVTGVNHRIRVINSPT
ncbi:hypothetical protein [Phaeocystidibacter marisrubri]|uniref:Uncharacterized protein n=1 Tax=Phaeocystidibacter marisrubri TaxID=1577780 RepID=A0A6L3ZCM5_9FLAO|nr:hypothetical protein [Phaeocystidibacter marisrubri]KAB2815613.1 hypothetical protein F8C82_07880 [Phaeocystidibacter marisrubri]GGH64795.1 hypothetical protein GCM10011318_01180 [Phaeocystidibacter marisrubri]